LRATGDESTVVTCVVLEYIVAAKSSAPLTVLLGAEEATLLLASSCGGDPGSDDTRRTAFTWEPPAAEMSTRWRCWRDEAEEIWEKRERKEQLRGLHSMTE
jgi:hypothetical protein